ncbi:MAG TPA: hypothetical protein VGK67_13585 [Myxococcales bacterium]
MNVTTTDAGTTLPFDRFWRWVKDHASCILEAGTTATSLFDFEDFHWGFVQEEEGRVIAQVIRGKNLVAELVIDPSEITYVQATPDVEGADRGQWIFECMAGKAQEEYVAAYFVLAHGVEEIGKGKHEVLKH